MIFRRVMFTLRLGVKLALAAILTLSFYSSAYASSGIQACLEVYQAKAEEPMGKIKTLNQKTKSIPYARYLGPGDFPHMYGPGHYFYKNEEPYIPLSIMTLGALPVIHWGIKGAYKLGTVAISGIADTTVIPAINLGKKIIKTARTKKVINPYEEEIALIQDIIQYNGQEIIFSDRFKGITERNAVRKKYPNFLDVYSILKLTFEKQLPCSQREGFVPSSLAHIIRDLESGNLAIAIGYERVMESGLPEMNVGSSSRDLPPYWGPKN